MAMPEYQVIKIRFLQQFPGILDQPFLVLAEETLIDLAGDRPAATAEITRETHAYCRGQQPEQPLTTLIPEYLFQEFITVIARTETIPMPDKEFLPVPFECLR